MAKKQKPAAAAGGPRIRNKGIRLVRVADIEDNPLNFRTHPEAQRAAFAGVETELGFYGYPDVYETEAGTIRLIDGQLRKEHLLSKYGNEATIEVNMTDFDEDEAKKALLTHDPLSAMAEADRVLLDQLLREVDTGDEALQQMMTDLADEAGLYQDDSDATEIEEDEVPEPPVDPITKPGDLWILGEHRVLCGDSTKAEDVGRLMAGETADLLLTDPPYGISWNGDYTRFRKKGKVTCANQYQDIKGDSESFDPRRWMEYRNVIMWGANLYAAKLPVGTWLVWDKRAADGSAFLADAEVGWKKGGYGVYIKSINQKKQASKLKDIAHPTKKPVELFVWCIEKSGDAKVIFDPYCGSGTAIIAAEQLGRKCYGMEISPAYCDVIVRRWENLTGKKAVLEGSH